MILDIQNVSKYYDGNCIIKKCDFHIEEGEKAAIVGANGAGKTTLIKMITGEEDHGGVITISRDKKIGYLAQYQDDEKDSTLYETVLKGKQLLIDMEEELSDMERSMGEKAGGELETLMDSYHSKNDLFKAMGGEYYRGVVRSVIIGLGFDEADFDRKLEHFSGGQKTRIAMARLLASEPDILLLDEPTNHLDVASVSFLESFLRDYRGAVILVSHDRFFLDQVVTKVIEIENRESHVYNGNYSVYSEKKKKDREVRLKAYLNNKAEIERQEAVIAKLKSFNREKSIKRAESREKLLGKMERLEAPESESMGFRLTLTPNVESGEDVLSVEGLSKSYGGNRLFSDLDIEIKKGERVALIGDNGTGKTTILKIINHLVPADNGRVRLGANVHIGYYDQEQQQFDEENTLFDEISDAWPDMDNTRIRNHLAAFLFTGDDVFKQVKVLSGGERGRLSLARLMLSEANFLILDEPTNHLDILSAEILENALVNYAGTVFFVSHDRFFINRCATRILELEGGKLKIYPGNYDYYLEKKKTSLPENAEIKGTPVKEGKSAWEENKRIAAENRKREKHLAEVESEIEELEDKKTKLGEEFVREDVASNSVRLQEVCGQISDIDERLQILYDEWEALS